MPEPESIEALEAKVRQLITDAHKHTQAGDDGEAVRVLSDAGEAALKVVQARVESDEVPMSAISADDHAAYDLAQRASTEYQLAKNRLGEWFRESGRRRALERYTV